VKRGLFGQLIAEPLGLNSYKRFALICPCSFLSYGLTYLVNLNGYFDLLLASLAAEVLLIGQHSSRLYEGNCVPVHPFVSTEEVDPARDTDAARNSWKNCAKTGDLQKSFES